MSVIMFFGDNKFFNQNKYDFLSDDVFINLSTLEPTTTSNFLFNEIDIKRKKEVYRDISDDKFVKHNNKDGNVSYTIEPLVSCRILCRKYGISNVQHAYISVGEDELAPSMFNPLYLKYLALYPISPFVDIAKFFENDSNEFKERYERIIKQFINEGKFNNISVLLPFNDIDKYEGLLESDDNKINNNETYYITNIIKPMFVEKIKDVCKNYDIISF
jgi:hypothetical protein